MRYEIKGGSFPVVVCELENGEQMITERGSMVWMSPNMDMETHGGGLGRMFARAFSGESMFQNTYTSRGRGMIAFGSSFPGEIKAITIAPEVPGAYALAEALTARGVRVQAGHTDADYAAMEESIHHGFTGLTHTYNAMPGIHHRNPGPVVFGMVHDEMCLEAICDFVHLAAPVVKMFFRTKGPQGIAMISDAVSVAGLPDGVYGDIIVRDSRALTRDGGISGSFRQLDTGVANVVSLGIPMEDAIRAASTTPAEYLGFGDELGSIAPGKRACLAAWNNRFECKWGFNGSDLRRAK